jgi:hypothetical protein
MKLILTLIQFSLSRLGIIVTYFTMKKFLSIIFFSILSGWTSQNCFCADLSRTEEPRWTGLNEVYFESLRLSNIDTVAGYTQIRSGALWAPVQLEGYAIARMSADTRTLMDSSSYVYNDNYLFAGVGFDFLGIAPGTRLTLQVGGSFDLTNKIHESGFDFRFGSQTYHEVSWIQKYLRSEIYSEALYFQRYKDILGSLQFRTIYKIWDVTMGGGRTGLELGPLVNLVGSFDTVGLDYNRFLEARIGPRLTFRGPISLALTPYYVWGGRWGRPTDLPNYQDFRVLLTGFFTL